MKEKFLLYLALFIGAASLIYIATNSGEIQNYLEHFQYQSVSFQNQGKKKCSLLLECSFIYILQLNFLLSF